MNSTQYQTRQIFRFLFICVAITATITSVTSEILSLNNSPRYLYGVVWIGTFGIIFGFYFLHFKEKTALIWNRMKNSLSC